MKYITPQHMIGLNDELQKEAGRVGSALRAVRNYATSRTGQTVGLLGREMKGQYGKQMGLGAGLGAAGGVALADPDERGSRFRGAMRGALIGGGLTGAGILATKRGRQDLKKGLGNFYQRQRYSLTGLGLGDTEAQKLKKAREIGLVEKFDPTKFDVKHFGDDVQKATIAANKASAAEKARLAIQEDALRKNYMSVPGTIHGMLTQPGAVLKSGWKRGGSLGKAFAGLGAYETGKGLIEKPEPGGPGRLEKGLRGAGSAVGWVVAPTTLLGGQIVGMGGGSLGGQVGKVGDKLVNKVRTRGQVIPQGGY